MTDDDAYDDDDLKDDEPDEEEYCWASGHIGLCIDDTCRNVGQCMWEDTFRKFQENVAQDA